MILIIIIFIFFILVYPQRHLVIRRYSGNFDGQIKFLVLSDMHNNGFLPFERFKSILEAEKPDAIFLLGDMIDRKAGYKNTFRLLDIIVDYGSPIFYVNGNHEPHAYDKLKLWEKLDTIGAICLEDRLYEFKGLKLYGIKYKSKSNFEADIYLAHNPVDAVGSYHPGLYLSGHTHGGMVRFPFIGTFYVPGQKLFPKYDKGLYSLCKKDLIITSGIGNTFLPIRFMNPIEVLILS